MNHDLDEVNNILQLKPTSILIISLRDNIFIMENFLRNKMYENPPGVYLLNSINPVLKSNHRYYTKSGLKKDKHILENELDSLVEDIYNSDGDIVIKADVMRNKKHLLKNQPTINPRLIKIAELLVNEHINNKSPVFSKRYNCEEEILNHILPEYHTLYTEGHLSVSLDKVFLQIEDFIGNDTWFIYFLKLIGTDIVIEKTVDYRIYEYTKQNFLIPPDIVEF